LRINRSWPCLVGAAFLAICNTPLRAEDGVFKDRILFGQVAALNGPAQALGQGMREGMQAGKKSRRRSPGFMSGAA